MNQADKYPHLSNADLAELLANNRLIQFQPESRRFHQDGAYVPYGNDLVEAIRARLLAAPEPGCEEDAATEELVDTAKDLFNVKSRKATSETQLTPVVELSYYFERNYPLDQVIRNAMQDTNFVPQRDNHTCESLTRDIVNSIRANNLVARHTPSSKPYYLQFARRDGQSKSLNIPGAIIATDPSGEWVIWQGK